MQPVIGNPCHPCPVRTVAALAMCAVLLVSCGEAGPLDGVGDRNARDHATRRRRASAIHDRGNEVGRDERSSGIVDKHPVGVWDRTYPVEDGVSAPFATRDAAWHISNNHDGGHTCFAECAGTSLPQGNAIDGERVLRLPEAGSLPCGDDDSSERDSVSHGVAIMRRRVPPPWEVTDRAS